MESKPPSYTLENPYFFCENGEEFAWKEAAEEIARGLHRAEKINEVTVKTIPEDLYDDVCVSAYSIPKRGSRKSTLMRKTNDGGLHCRESQHQVSLHAIHGVVRLDYEN